MRVKHIGIKKKSLWLLAAVQILAVVLCAGCGKNISAGIPALEEPVSANEAYRPVETGSIGTVQTVLGTVVPTNYCAFYHTNVTVAEIMVEVGDMVQAGDVLAYADIDAAKEALSGLIEELSYENQTYESGRQISQLRIEKLGWQKQQLEVALQQQEDSISSEGAELPDEEVPSDEIDQIETIPMEEMSEMDAAYFDTQIQIEQENARYDKMLHEYRVEKLQQSIAKQQEIIDDGTLRAVHAGQVTFVKDLAYDANAGTSENIVIVSDMEDSYIELGDMNVGSYPYTDYEVKYLKKAGTVYPVEEIPYTSDEMILAKATGSYPCVRLSCPGAGKLNVGDVYPIYYIRKQIEDVLIVGRDSVYEEGGESFVYVKNENNEREKRKITLGEKDTNYAEVVSGLSEGEMVYYTSNSMMPADYSTYEVKLSDFNLPNLSRTYEVSDTVTYLYNSEYEGTLVDISVAEDQEVKAGDLLYIVNCGEGKAALTEMKNNINRENMRYAESMEAYAEQIKGLEESIGQLLAGSAEAESLRCDLDIIRIERALAVQSHANSLKQMQSAYDKMSNGNDGNGNISVYAKDDGVISKVAVHKGDRIDVGSEILGISVPAKEKLLVKMREMRDETVYVNNIADIGEVITVAAGSATYTGHCIGLANDRISANKVYASSDDDGVYISYNKASTIEEVEFYTQMDDASFYETLPKGALTFSYIYMQDVAVLPIGLVHQESMSSNPSLQVDYVWRIVEGELVKQYVLVDWDNLKDTNNIVVLSGIKEGDVLAAEY